MCERAMVKAVEVCCCLLAANCAYLVVTNVRIQRRHKHQTIAHQAFNPLRVRNDADDAVVSEGSARVANQSYRREQVADHHRLEDVELKVAVRASESDGAVISDNLRADHRHRLALRGVDLAWHDRRARLVLREGELAEPRAWPTTKEADVVGDLV